MAKKKLIEVYIPLDKINAESAREKSIRHGHPSTLHLWWSRKPLSTCRAVLFAQLVDDPLSHPDKFPTLEAQKKERDRLCKIIEELVVWENINNEELLAQARQEIINSTGFPPPPILDPFCGGGSIPLEAQRLGLEAHGSDLNPVAVLITKALIEIPPKFAGLPSVHPDEQGQMIEGDYKGAEGLAEDIRYYGKWMRDEAEKRIGHLYPKVKLPEDQGGGEAVVIAWLWARTVASPNPSCNGAHVPLTSSFYLSKKKNRQAWVEPIIDRKNNSYRFEVRTGQGKPREGTVSRRGGVCLLSGVPIPFEYIREEGKAGRMGTRLMAIVAQGESGRVYVSPVADHVAVTQGLSPTDIPATDLPKKALGFRVQRYGMTKHAHLFTPRQLVALTTFSDLVMETRAKVLEDALKAGMEDRAVSPHAGGRGAQNYANALAVYLAFGVDKLADYGSSICSWHVGRDTIRNTFARQAIPMVWDYAEANPFSSSTGNFLGAVEWVAKCIQVLSPSADGTAVQGDAAALPAEGRGYVISTDPPYYDNISYADLSDFFYVWLRRSLNSVYPELFRTVLVPKAQELVANPHRFDGDRDVARDYFEDGLGKAFTAMRATHHAEFPLTAYYAFKQSEASRGGSGEVVFTGWETMLEGLIAAGFAITGTWPMRTELINRPVAIKANALASSIVLVCRPRAHDAPMTTRRDFVNSLMRELPDALRKLQEGNIAPVDLQQAIIGPGMAVFSRYSKVIEADGSPMSVRTALALINQILSESLVTEQEGDYDPDTRWAVAWFEQYGYGEGPYGVAETLSKAKNVSTEGLEGAGILVAKGGNVRLLGVEQLDPDWDPHQDKRLTVWQATQHLLKAHKDGGEGAVAALLKKLGGLGESARHLAYRLYMICEDKGWAAEGYRYNALVASWSEVTRLAGRLQPRPAQDIKMIGE